MQNILKIDIKTSNSIIKINGTFNETQFLSHLHVSRETESL